MYIYIHMYAIVSTRMTAHSTHLLEYEIKGLVVNAPPQHALTAAAGQLGLSVIQVKVRGLGLDSRCVYI